MTDERLTGFVSLLRQNGLRVSPGESADAARALMQVSFENRAIFRSALRATLVKRGQDAGTFDRLFELYFGAVGRLLEGLEETLARALAPDDLTMDELQAIAKELNSVGQGTPLAGAMLRGQMGEIARLLRAAALNVNFSGLGSSIQRGFYSRRIMAQFGISEVSAEFARLTQALAERGIDPATIERVSARLTAAVEALEDVARRVADMEQKSRDREATARIPDATLHRNIASLTPQELRAMQDVVKRLAEKLKARLARKRKVRARGHLHVRRTIRKNLGIGGIPMQLVFRRRRPDRPDVVLLCDVSDSVRNVSRLMLQFLHTLQNQYSRVRSFVFVSDIGEVTAALKDANVEDAVDGAIAGRVINLSANSNYGHALKQFHTDFRGAVSRKTTVVVIGDGRSNYNPANAWVLGELRQKARRLVWLCPEERTTWGFGDSEMIAYARHCHQVLVVRTVDDLARAAEKILP
jgi:uncharacterized protein with von Willebrand factor type A (vWA) domain